MSLTALASTTGLWSNLLTPVFNTLRDLFSKERRKSERLEQNWRRHGEQRFQALRHLRAFTEGFSLKLQETAQRLAGTQRGPGIIVFVDELDRCRPSFAVELLERLKHFFDVPRVAFVIAVDRPQLESSIRSTYGPDIDAENYLRRFFNLRVQLPEPLYGDYVRHLAGELQAEELYPSSPPRLVQLIPQESTSKQFMAKHKLPSNIDLAPYQLFCRSLIAVAQSRELSLRSLDQVAELAVLVARRYPDPIAAAALPIVAVTATSTVLVGNGRKPLFERFQAADWTLDHLQEAFPRWQSVEFDAALLAIAEHSGRFEFLDRSQSPARLRPLSKSVGGTPHDLIAPLLLDLTSSWQAQSARTDLFRVLAHRTRELGSDLNFDLGAT